MAVPGTPEQQITELITAISARGHALRTATRGTEEFNAAARRLAESLGTAAELIKAAGQVGRPEGVSEELWNRLQDTYRTQVHTLSQEVGTGKVGVARLWEMIKPYGVYLIVGGVLLWWWGSKEVTEEGIGKGEVKEGRAE